MSILKNPRHEIFAQFVAAGKSAGEAYVAAGFSAGKNGNQNRGAAQSASRLLRNPLVAARVRELTSEAQGSRSTKAWLDRQFVIEGLKRNFDRAMQAEPVLDSNGEPTGEYRYNGTVANKALELLGKEMGMFVERHLEIKHPRDWTLAEWDQEMADYAAKVGVPLDVLTRGAEERMAQQEEQKPVQ